MNWKIEGKKPNGKPGSFTMIGAATEPIARETASVTHPDFTIEKVTPIDGNLKATEAIAESAPHAKTTAKH